eukprot:m.256361 g.256361  ORF g.256361 m.256361 type:complete len:837 (-) comp20124_c0_seq1:184-2694(-)
MVPLLMLWLPALAAAITLTPDQPFRSNVTAGLHPLELRFDFNSTLTPRVQTRLLGLATNKSSVAVLLSDACSASAYSLPSINARRGDCSSVVDSRPVCQNKCGYGNFSLDLTSYDTRNVSLVVELENIALAMDVPKTVSVWRWSPVILRFEFAANAVDSVTFEVRSATEELVATVSIQNESCPVFDLADNVDYQGKRQTFTTQADIRADLKDSDTVGVFVVIVLWNVHDCDIEKTITITPRYNLPTSDYAAKVAIMVSWFLAPMAVFFLFLAIERYRLHGFSFYDLEPEQHINPDFTDREDEYVELDMPLSPSERPVAPQSVRSDWNDGTYDERSVYYYRSKIDLRVSDLSRAPYAQFIETLRSYILTLLAIGVFYALPVAQLVTGYLSQYREGREDMCYYNFACARPVGDLPQFNNIISNSGYVFLGGLFLFLVWRRSFYLHYEHRNKIRKRIGQQALLDESEAATPETTKGLPRTPGLFYAAGVSLIMEGVFSSCYHICPTLTNFQFDVAFMYMIAGLLTMALYQRRHSDTRAGAGTIFTCFAGLILLNVLGVYWNSYSFYTLVACIFVVFTLILSFQVYTLGLWRVELCARTEMDPFENESIDTAHGAEQDGSERHGPYTTAYGIPQGSEGHGPYTTTYGTAKSASDSNGHLRVPFLVLSPARLFAWLRSLTLSDCRCRHALPLRPYRAMLLIALNICNASAAAVGLIYQWADVSSFFLGVIILNFLIYLVYYFLMKVLYAKERLKPLPVAFLIISLCFWGPALYYFTRGLTSWTDTPAVSREGNAPCMLLDFYDSHDVWHMLSAGGLFFGCLSLLLLDDDLVHVERWRIAVF